MLTLIVDFNAAKDGVVRGLIEDVDGHEPVDGALILLRDGEGNEALGVIRDIADGLVHAEVDWNTWSPEGTIQVVVSQVLPSGRGSVVESISGLGTSNDRNSRGGVPARLEAAEQLAVA